MLSTYHSTRTKAEPMYGKDALTFPNPRLQSVRMQGALGTHCGKGPQALSGLSPSRSRATDRAPLRESHPPAVVTCSLFTTTLPGKTTSTVQADFFKEVDRVNKCLHFTSGSYGLHTFLFQILEKQTKIDILCFSCIYFSTVLTKHFL